MSILATAFICAFLGGLLATFTGDEENMTVITRLGIATASALLMTPVNLILWRFLA